MTGSVPNNHVILSVGAKRRSRRTDEITGPGNNPGASFYAGEEFASGFAEASKVPFSHVLARVAATTGLAVSSIATLSGCQPYGCQPGFSTPAEAKRDLAEFNYILARNPAFRGLKATAVHGHELDVVDTNLGQDMTRESSHGSGIVDKLRDAWRTTFVRLHPNEHNAKIVEIDLRDGEGRRIALISSRECMTL